MHRIEARAADDYAAERANQVQLEASIDQLKTQSNSTSMKLVPLRQLEREVEALRGAYGRFAKIKDNLTEQEAESPPARIIAVAEPALKPSSPHKAFVLFASLAIGLLVGSMAAIAQAAWARELPNIQSRQ